MALGSVTVSFDAPLNDGGSPVTGYQVTSNPGGITATGTSSPILVSGLTDGVSYTFTVTAMNAVGTSSPSAPSNSETPSTIPGAPTGLVATPGNAQVSVSFTAPADDGGSAILSYTVTSSPGSFTASAASSPITVTGLANGTAYTFTAVAVNANGAGPASTPSSAATPQAAVPNPPTALNATAGNGQASITFTPPTYNGGSPITSYLATSNPGGFTGSASGSPVVVSGLANGTVYNFTAVAINMSGASNPSAPSNSVTPASVPGQPTAVTGSPGNAQVVVSFTAPVSTGGSPITSYTATANPSGATKIGANSPLTFTNLTNGQPYTFTVIATNAVGNSVPSSPSAAVTPYTVPGAATNLVATASNAQASISFTAAPNNGSAITGYVLTSSPGSITGSGTASPVVVTGLTNGTAYTFTAVATNGAGAGATSAPSNSVTPAAVPGQPTAVVGTPGNAQVSVAFTAPSSTGGSPISSYTATASPGGATKTGASSPLVVTGLTNGTAYTFTVYATNAAGNGAASSPSSSVTPYTVPGAATGIVATAGNAQAQVTFTAPASTGGSAITGYTATSFPGSISASGSSPITVTGLTNGTAYTFTVVATNAAGNGPASAPSNSVTPTSSGSPFTYPTKRLLPNAATGSSYSYAFPLSGGTPGYSGTIINASANLLSSSAAVAPTPVNSYSFSGSTLVSNGTLTGVEIDYLECKLSDSAGNSYTAIYVVNVSAGATPLVINTPIVITDRVLKNTTYTSGSPLVTVTCVGNVAAPTWSMTSAGGFSINSSTGAITGTAATVGTFSLPVSVTDGTNSASLTLYVTVNAVVTSATRPAGNTGSGFFVLNSAIYDPNGDLFRIRGLDECHPGNASAASYVAMGANTVRVFNPTSVSQVTSHIAAGTVPVPVAAYTSGGTQTSCSASVPVLASVVQTWISSYSSYSPYQNQFILNIANEWGPDTLSTWANAFTAVFGNITAVSGNTLTVNTVSSTNPFANCPFAYITGGGGIAGQFVTISSTGGSSGAWTVTMSAPITGSYTSGGVLNGGAVGALRGAGYTCPLMIDCNGCGQNNVAITSNANAIYQSDPQKNLIFSLHIYGSIPTADVASVVDGIQAAAITYGFAVAVMEFGPGRNFGPSPTFTTPYQVITACEANGVGWASWAADANNLSGEGSNDNSYSMLYFPYNPIQPTNYTAYGKQVCVDPLYGTIANAVAATAA